MTSVYTARQQQYIQSFMLKGEALLKEAFAPNRPNDVSVDMRLEQLSMALNTVTAVTAIAGAAAAPPTLGLALVGAGAGIVILQAANGVVNAVKHHCQDSAAPVADETHWESDFLTWRIDIREVAEGAALRYKHLIDEVLEERSVLAFAHVGAERVIKQLNVSPKISPADLIEYLMISAKLSITHATERIVLKKEYAPRSLLLSNDAHAKWGYARPRIMVCQKTAPFKVAYCFYRSPQERMYLQVGTTLPHYGYMSLVEDHLNADITRHDRRFVAMTDTHDIEARVKPHIGVYYSVTWDEVSIYLEHTRTEAAAGRCRPSLNQYLSYRLSLTVIAACHRDLFTDRDLSGGDFSEINGRGLQLERCNLENTKWDGAHLERALFRNNQRSVTTSCQHTFFEQSTWIDEVLIGDCSHARMNGARLTCCVISAHLQDRGCVWDGAVLDAVQMEAGLEETLKVYVDAQRKALQDDLTHLNHRLEEHTEALAEVFEQIHQLQDDVSVLQEKPLHDLREQVRMNIETLFDEAMRSFYVDLNVVSSGMGAAESVPLWDRLEQYIDHAEDRFFLLHGDIGSGKSLSVLRLAKELAQRHASADDWFPVYIQLKHINDRWSGNFLDGALRTVFSPERIGVLKEQCHCVIILDGLDECGIDFSQRALLMECSDTAQQWKKGIPKIILTAQTRCLIDRDYHHFLRVSPQRPFPRQSEYAIQPLNDAQIDSYIQSYDPDGVNFSAIGATYTEIKALAKSPIMLHIICVVLQAAEEQALLPPSRVAFYDAFFYHWGQHIRPKILTEHFTETSVQTYCRRIAYQMFVEGTDCIDRPYQWGEKEALQLEEERRLASLHPQSFASVFDNPVWIKAGSLTPMSAILMDDRSPPQVRHTFVHQSFQYYALAHGLIDMLIEDSPTQRLVNWNYSFLSDTLGVFDFFSGIIQAHPQKKSIIMALRDMVSASGAPDGSQWSKAASNAITLLNVFGVDFSLLVKASEWQKIHVPRAYLKGALLASVDLSNSDLSGVVFDNAVLAGCNMSGSNLAGTRFLDTRLFGFTEKPSQFVAVFPANAWIVTHDGTCSDGAYGRRHTILNAGLEGTLYPSFRGHDDVIRIGVWGVSNGERRFASGGDGGTVRVQRVLENGQPGGEIAKLKHHLRGAVLSMSWSKEGNILAAGGEYPQIRLWNVDEKICEVVPGIHAGTVRAVLLGQMKPVLLSAGDEQIVRLWVVTIEARRLKSMSLACAKEKQLPAAIHALALSTSEDAFAAGCADSTIYLYSTERTSFESTTALKRLIGHSDTVTSVIWNAYRLVSASHDSTVRVWDVNNGVCVSVFQGDKWPAKQLAWLPGGRHVIAGGGGKSRMLFVVDTDVQSNPSPEIDGLTHHVTCIAPFGQYLATGNLDGSVWLWNIKRLPVNQSRPVLRHEGVPVLQIEWSQDGQYLASRSRRDIRIREMDGVVERPNEWHVIPFDRHLHATHMTWLNDLKSKQSWLAIGGADGKMHLWKPSLVKQEDAWIRAGCIEWGVENAIESVRCVVAAPSRWRILNAEVPSMSTLNSEPGLNASPTPSAPAAADDLNELTCSPDSLSSKTRRSDEFIDSNSPNPAESSGNVSTSGGSTLATNWLAASRGASIRIWDLRQEGEAVFVQECLGHARSIMQLNWSPDGRFLASMDEGFVVWVWETSDWACIFKDESVVDEKQLSWAMVGEDKLWLVLGSLDEIRIFDASQQFTKSRPVKQLSWGADQISYHAGILFLVKNRSVDMINWIQWMFGGASSSFFLGRIGSGLCMQRCVATGAQHMSPATKAFIKNQGAVVSDDAPGSLWRFFSRQKTPSVTAFPAILASRDAVEPMLEPPPSVHMR